MDGPIDWLPDGSITFTAGDNITWASPTLGQLRRAKNGHAEMADALQALVADQSEDDFDNDAVTQGLEELVAKWVRATHIDVGSGQLPSKVDDWPHWLAALHGFRFASKVLEHWGTYPFALRTTNEEQTETAP